MRPARMAPVLFCTLLAVVLSVAVGAQSKEPPAASDYGQWETLAAQSRGGLSPDGRWLVYGINRSNRILQWFGHYLRNEPAPAWITSGVSVLEREQELKRASKKGS